MTKETTTRLYAGWHRPGPSRPWRKLVEADDRGECHDLVCARVDGGEVRVLPAGEHPLTGRR